MRHGRAADVICLPREPRSPARSEQLTPTALSPCTSNSNRTGGPRRRASARKTMSASGTSRITSWPVTG
jgi:hypothetical protein